MVVFNTAGAWAKRKLIIWVCFLSIVEWSHSVHPGHDFFTLDVLSQCIKSNLSKRRREEKETKIVYKRTTWLCSSACTKRGNRQAVSAKIAAAKLRIRCSFIAKGQGEVYWVERREIQEREKARIALSGEQAGQDTRNWTCYYAWHNTEIKPASITTQSSNIHSVFCMYCLVVKDNMTSIF